MQKMSECTTTLGKMGDSETEKQKKESFCIFPPKTKKKKKDRKKLPPSKRRECLVKGCPYKFDRNHPRPIKPYNLPGDPDLRALWVGFASLSGPVKIRARSGICKAHFREDQFVLSDILKTKYGFMKNEPRLKKTAVPTLVSEEIRKKIQQSWTEGKERRNWKGVLESLHLAADKNSNQPEDAGMKIATRTPMPTPMPTSSSSRRDKLDPFGGGYGLSVGDFCVPESAPTQQEATWFEKKPSPEELAMALQATMASTSEAQELTVPPVPNPIQLTLQCNTGGTTRPFKIKNEPLSDSEEPSFPTANPQPQVEEEIPSSPPSPLPFAVSRVNFQRNTSVLMACAPPPPERSASPPLQGNAISTDVMHPGGQDPMQQSSTGLLYPGGQVPMQQSSTGLLHPVGQAPMQHSSTGLLYPGGHDPMQQSSTGLLYPGGHDPMQQSSTGLLYPGGQDPIQQSVPENAQSAVELHKSGPENDVLKKILAVHQGMFPARSARRIQIKKTDSGIVAIVTVPKQSKGPVAPASGSASILKKPAILTTHMPTKTIKLAITKTRPSQPQPKHNKRKSAHLTKVVPEEEDEAEEGWEEVTEEDDVLPRRGANRDADGEELNEEDELRRAAETVEECAQSMLESDSGGGFDQGYEAEMQAAENVEECAQSMMDYDGGFDQGYDAEIEEAEQVYEIEDDEEEEVMEEEYEEEDYDEESLDDPNDSDYDPFKDIEESFVKKKSQLGKPVTELEVSSSEGSVSSFNSDEEEEEEKSRKKKKQKTRTEWPNRFSLSGDERRKHNLKLQLAKTKQLLLECKLCKDSFFTVQDFQLHFEEKHPGEAEKLVTDLVLTLERKRIAFGEQKEKEAQERKDQLMLKMKKIDELVEKKKQKKTKTAQEKKAAREEKMRLEKLAECESQPRKSTRLGLKSAKKVTENAESKCENSGSESQRLEPHSSTTEPELDPKPADVPTNDQSSQQDAYNASIKESELQTEEENGTKGPTDMTFEETDPQRDKVNEDTSTNTDITMQETDARRDEVHEDTKLSMDSILQEKEQRDAENKDSNTTTDVTMQESDAQTDKENEDGKNLIDATMLETYAQREDEHDDTQNLMQEHQSKDHPTKKKETETSNEPQTVKSDLVEKRNVYYFEHVGEHKLEDLENGCNNKQLIRSEPLETAVRTDNKTEVEDTPVEADENLQSPTNLGSAEDASEPSTHSKPVNEFKNGGTFDSREINQSDLSETIDNQDTQSEDYKHANCCMEAINDRNADEHKYEAGVESSMSECTEAANLNKTIDGQAAEHENEDKACELVSDPEAEDNEMQSDVRSQALADGASVANSSEPMINEPTSEGNALPGDNDAEVIIESIEPEEVEFVPEDDEDVVFELEVWSNILLKCAECSGYFDYRKYNSHLNEHEEERKTKECEKCGKKFISEKNLRMHQKDCSGEKRKKKRNCEYGICEVCGKYVINVTQHLRVHKKDTFTCKICNATFRSKSHRDRHILVHSSVKEHVCEICGRSFSQASNMRGHMRQHTQEKPYKCDMCEKSFVHNVSLKTHQKRYHGMDPWMGAKTAAVGRRKKERDEPSENTAKKRRPRKKETDGGSSDETAVKRKRGRKKK